MDDVNLPEEIPKASNSGGIGNGTLTLAGGLGVVAHGSNLPTKEKCVVIHQYVGL